MFPTPPVRLSLAHSCDLLSPSRGGSSGVGQEPLLAQQPRLALFFHMSQIVPELSRMQSQARTEQPRTLLQAVTGPIGHTAQVPVTSMVGNQPFSNWFSKGGSLCYHFVGIWNR